MKRLTIEEALANIPEETVLTTLIVQDFSIKASRIRPYSKSSVGMAKTSLKGAGAIFRLHKDLGIISAEHEKYPIEISLYQIPK